MIAPLGRCVPIRRRRSFFRVNQQIIQWGAYDRSEHAEASREQQPWARLGLGRTPIRDDPSWCAGLRRGQLAYAGGGPHTRGTQFIWSLHAHPHLGRETWEVPFAEVRGEADMRTLDRAYAGYGEIAPWGPGPDQRQIMERGAEYLANWPKLDYNTGCAIIGAAPRVRGHAGPAPELPLARWVRCHVDGARAPLLLRMRPDWSTAAASRFVDLVETLHFDGGRVTHESVGAGVGETVTLAHFGARETPGPSKCLRDATPRHDDGGAADGRKPRRRRGRRAIAEGRHVSPIRRSELALLNESGFGSFAIALADVVRPSDFSSLIDAVSLAEVVEGLDAVENPSNGAARKINRCAPVESRLYPSLFERAGSVSREEQRAAQEAIDENGEAVEAQRRRDARRARRSSRSTLRDEP